jgi:hypothetical protein
MNTLQYYSGDRCRNSDVGAILSEEALAFRTFLDQRQQQRKQARKNNARPPKQVKKTKRRRAKTTPEIRWLKNLICPFVFGEKTPDGIRPSVTKSTFIGLRNMGLGLPSLPNYRLLDHFSGLDTLYYFGNGWRQAKRTLVMIDIDVLKSKGLGTPDGAKSFARHLNSIWPNLYFEVSTNGMGIHGYLILRKKDADSKRTNAALKRLEAWLRNEARKISADIEQVELKGACLDMTFDNGLLQAVRYGSFAKLPRDVSRFSEWQNTTTLRVQDLESSVFDVIVPAEPISVMPKPETLEKMPIPTVSLKNKVSADSGSVSGKVISEVELAGIPQFEELYRGWIGPNDLMAGKFRVTAHDFAVAMVILRHFKDDPNPDQSLPCRRVGELWTAMFNAGDVDRGWNHHRWKRIRDFLSARGHIDWKDHRYQYKSQGQGQGKPLQGIACKWSISDELYQTLERVALTSAVNTGEASFADTEIRTMIPSQGKGHFLTPKSFPLWDERQQKFWLKASEACENLFAA